MRPERQTTKSTRPRAWILASLLCGAQALAQVPVDEQGNPIGSDVEPLSGGVSIENPTIEGGDFSALELETLVGPIALYPDDLLAIVLPASTYPLEIVQAARFLDAVDTDSSLEPDENWDDSIVALLNYPDVLYKMNEDIDWTWRLGEAVVSQQAEVIVAIESFRDRAYAAGNLKSDEHQTVTIDDGVIEIEPVADDVIYVPYYEPAQVVAVSPRPVYHYYPDPYPVYFYPYSRRHFYRSRPFWGVTTAFTIGWATDRLHVYHSSYDGHPFFGHTYYGSYWRRPPIHIYNSYYVDRFRYRPRHRIVGDYWRPRHRSGPRPRTVRNFYSGPRNDRRSGRPETRSYRETRQYRDNRNQRFSDTIRNASRVGTDRDVRLNRRAANSGRNVQRNRNETVRQTRNRRSTVDRDAIKFRARGDGRYTGTRVERARRADNRRETEIVRQSRTVNRGVNRSANRAANGTRTAAPRATTQRRGFTTTRPAVNNRAANRDANRTRAATQRRGFTSRPAVTNRATNRNANRTRANAVTERRSAPRQVQRRPAAANRSAAPRPRSANRSSRATAPARAVKRSESRRSQAGSSRRESRRSGRDSRRPR